ncbi:MAG: NUDIX domain-containing protein [Rhodospirillaceae bacterium]|nr:NUDIX domain-containing protein [Rhodospirillaceae bacterium]
MTTDEIDIIERTSPFRGYFRLDRYLLKHGLFKGGWSDTISREILERGHAIGLLPYDPDLDKLVLIEQFRTGAYAARTSPIIDNNASPWLIECVAGIIEEGEQPEDVVRREAIEECGCPVSDLLPIHTYYASPGCSSETVALYCGRIDASNAGGIFGLDHENEDIRVFTVSPDEAFDMMAKGQCNNSMALIALQWFCINRDEVRRKWLSG